MHLIKFRKILIILVIATRTLFEKSKIRRFTLSKVKRREQDVIYFIYHSTLSEFCYGRVLIAQILTVLKHDGKVFK